MVKPRTAREYEAEISALRLELESLKTSQTVVVSGASSSTGSQDGTLSGAEEMILQVALDNTIDYVNAQMATLLDLPDRRAALGTPLRQWDRGPLGEGTLTMVVEVARLTPQAHVVERSFPGLPPARLPGSDNPRPAVDPILRFRAQATEGRVQLVAQDVTRVRWLEQTFSRYVSPAIIEQMLSLPASRFMSMERREVTVLFGDLRGFTNLCQHLAPEQVQEMINSFLGEMVQAIEGLDGTVDKFVGDEVMAIFGAPVPQPDHALRAMVCAAEMQRLNRGWMQRREAAGLPARPVGIGLASGPAVVGNVGSPHRLDYTVLGHTVNLASRLCNAAEGNETLTNEATHQAAQAALPARAFKQPVPRMHFEPKGEMTFKHVDEPVKVIAVSVKPG
ncbi:MAG TPA: adenylate/guanylate cyclase domain-containing protein [Myxococcota bacterium]|nr:adenylate/guanylate cyclase domain-containing protein [Myxococcota bacterium]HRY92667.1 adenylate/guanylate cyclase domain-containing protein [Myxococcota bacterium]HSA21560.1 adenylate/guanylate cyclase domain-containing protein [Myxococcota bacterium]